MEKTKKILSITTIVTFVITAAMLIVLLFNGNLVTNRIFLNLLATFASIAIGGFFAINSMNMIRKNKVIGLVSLSLICLSVLLIILSVWISIDNPIYVQITGSLGLLSVLFNIIVSSGLDLGKNYLPLQIIVYLVSATVDVIATLGIFSVIDLSKILLVFIALCIVCIVGIITLKVIAKKKIDDLRVMDDTMVKITKEEYEMLVDKAKKYDLLISKQNEENNSKES